jgi:hypothetical protein
MLQLLQILIKVFYPQLETKLFYLNSFFVEKSTADAITILAPAVDLRLYHLSHSSTCVYSCVMRISNFVTAPPSKPTNE